MNPYRWIVGLALLPRALHVALIILSVLAVSVVALPATCAALVVGTVAGSPSPSAAADKLDALRGIPRPAALPEPSEQPEPVCFASDVRALCCPGACAAKNGPKWPQADQILQGCMRGLGCSEGDSKGATVGMKCDCKP